MTPNKKNYTLLTQSYLSTPISDRIANLCRKSVLGLALSLSPILLQNASAHNGLMNFCAGPIKCGTGGAGAAFATSAVDGAVNSALIAGQENNAILELGWLHANATSNTSSAPFGNPVGTQKSKIRDLPNFSAGISYKLQDNLTFGFSMVGSGLGSKYNAPVTNPAFQISPPFDKEIMYRLFNMTPTLAGKISETLSFGVGIPIGYADLKTDFAKPAGAQLAQTNGQNKRKNAFGLGGKFGFNWDAHEMLTLGASYATQVRFKKFGGGYSDILLSPLHSPATLVVGTAWHLNSNTDLLLDVKQLYYSKVKDFGTTPEKGGFGWKDQTVFMIGLTHRFEMITANIGYNYGKSPIKKDRSFANALTPSISEHHFTAGIQYKVSEQMELISNVWYSPKNSQVDPGTGDLYSQLGKGSKISIMLYGLGVGLKYNF